MTTHEEAEVVVRKMEGFDGPAVVLVAPLVDYWREHIQPAVSTPPEGCELVEEDGVPVFREPTDDDYGWVDLVGVADAGKPGPEFYGRRYIVRQVTPPVPTGMERLARLLAAEYDMPWERLATSHQTGYVEMAQELYDLGVRCPDQTED